ncbi:MAG: hypothetical protein ACTS5A_01320 [Candidatus Hodgkinia cicadicola]
MKLTNEIWWRVIHLVNSEVVLILTNTWSLVLEQNKLTPQGDFRYNNL